MKLFHRVILTLSLGLLPVMALWAALFYFAMVNEINDETDDVLGDYAELVMRRALAGKPLPAPNNGSNNSYSVTPVDEKYLAENPAITFYDETVYIPEKEETEPARVLKTVFCDAEGQYYEIKVATPTFERTDLLETIAYYIIGLYILLMLTIFAVVSLVYYYNMRPLYRLLEWFDKYRPGANSEPLPDSSSVVEFRKLSMAAQQAVERAEYYFEQQKQFIGNASHELQTPLAIIGTRIEWLVNNTALDEQQLEELLKIQRSLSRLVRLNRTLLLLSKIENGQFPEASETDLAAIIRENAETYGDIYEERNIVCDTQLPESFTVHMNESLATTLTNNLLKNSYLHNIQDGKVMVTATGRELTIANSGHRALDASQIFERFYHEGNPESTGLGLALVSSICRYYNIEVGYSFEEEMHRFTLKFPEEIKR
jgi:signal transduction histidine kinase